MRTTTTKRYQTRITTIPEGALVKSGDGQVIGTTPLTAFDAKVTYEEPSALGLFTFLASIPTVAGGATLLGFGMHGSYKTPEIECWPHCERTADTGYIALGTLIMLMGAIGFSMSAAALGTDTYLNGSLLEDEERFQLEALLDGKTPYALVSPGFFARHVSLKPGEKVTVKLVPSAKESVVASAQTQPDRVPTKDIESKPVERKPIKQHEKPVVKPQVLSGAPQHNAYALVVGVEKYRNLPSPSGAKGDAERFALALEKTLKVPAKHIHLLTDGNATRSDILAKLAWLRGNVPPDGRIYFYFSGHGAPSLESGASYLLPYEGKPETIAFSGIPISEVFDVLERSQAGEILAFLDTCFSGTGERSVLPEGTRPLVPVQKLEVRPRVALFAASGANETSGNLGNEQKGLFTHYVLEAVQSGVADIDGDGRISLEELKTYVSPRVSREARKTFRDQNPTLSVAQDLGKETDVFLLWGLPSR